MFQSILTIPSLFSSHTPPQEHENAQEFYNHLTSSEYKKTTEYIQAHPELINIALPGTSMTAFDLSLSQRKIESMKHLIASGAEINKPNNYGISGLDNLLLVKNRDLLKKVFGNALGTLLNDAQTQVDSSTVSYAILSRAESQIKMIKQEMKRHSDLTNIKASLTNFIPLIECHSYEILEEKIKEASKLEIFNLTIYSVFTHNNNLLKKLYESIGPDFLNLKTLDLKNLYQLAAIADNSDAIELFYEWGLDPALQFFSTSQHTFSPYHYAIFCPSFSTFLTLLKVGVPMPPPAPLQGFSHRTEYLNKTLANLTFSPIQLLVHRAAIIDPLSRESYFETLYLFSEAVALYYEMSGQMSTPVKAFLGGCRTSYFLGSTIQTFFNSKNSSLPLSISFLSFLSLAMMFEHGVLGQILLSENILPYLKYFTTLMTVKKIWNDFSSTYQSYSFRPLKTVWYFSKAMFSHFLYFKHTYFEENESFKNLEKESIRYQEESKANNDSDNQHTSNDNSGWKFNSDGSEYNFGGFKFRFQSGNFRHNRNQNPFIFPSKSHPETTDPEVNFEEIKQSVASLSYLDLYECGAKTGKTKPDLQTNIFQCLLGKYKNDFYKISEKDLDKLIRRASLIVHPDKLTTTSSIYREIVSLCEASKCQDLWNKHLYNILDENSFFKDCKSSACSKIVDSFVKKIENTFVSLNSARFAENST